MEGLIRVAKDTVYIRMSLWDKDLFVIKESLFERNNISHCNQKDLQIFYTEIFLSSKRSKFFEGERTTFRTYNFVHRKKEFKD